MCVFHPKRCPLVYSINLAALPTVLGNCLLLAFGRIFSVLMGDNVGPRKEFINEHANNLKLDDLDF